METYSRGSLLRNGHSNALSPWGTRAHARPTHTGAYIATERERGGGGGRRKRTGEPREEERKGTRWSGSASTAGPLLSYVWGTKKLSYNCCTPRGASRFPPIIVTSFRVEGWRNSRTRARNPRFIGRPRPTSLSTDLLRLVRGRERQPRKLPSLSGYTRTPKEYSELILRGVGAPSNVSLLVSGKDNRRS